MGIVLFGLWPNSSVIPGNHLSKTENILYQATSKIIWSLGLSFIIFSCCMNKGGNFTETLNKGRK
jgi:hypothetical protein